MFTKKLLPPLILITLLTAYIPRPSSASSFKKYQPKNLLGLTATKTVCASSCDYSTIQAALADPTADTLQLSAETYQESVTIARTVSILGAGSGSTIIQAASSQGFASSRVITVTNGVSVTIDGATIRHGVATGSGIDGYGGGILNQGMLTLQNSQITLNKSNYGGGIANRNQAGQATAIISNSMIEENEVFYDGGGLYNEAVQNGNTSVITLTQSTISENQADLAGGGVVNIASNGNARFSSYNSTFSSNSVDGNGGGLFNEVTNSGSAIANIAHSTFNNNSGGNIHNINGNIFINRSIIANAPGENLDCKNIGGSVFNGGFNLVEDGTCGFPSGGDPVMGNLVNNGGDTRTHALQPGSPALDAIPPTQCGATYDQRHIQRPFGAGCDIGAFELDTITLEFEQKVNDTNVIPGQLITFTVRVNPIGPGVSNGVITATVPEEFSIQWPIQLDPTEFGTIGEPPILAHSIVITANHELTLTMAAEVALGQPGGIELENVVSFQSTEISPPVVTTTTIHINNAPPIANDDGGESYQTNPNTFINIGNVLDNDSDPNDDPLIILDIKTADLKGSLTPLGIESGKPNGDGTFRYDPDGQFAGMLPGETRYDTFTYQISDGQGGESNYATVTIAIHQDSTFIYLPLITKNQ